MHRHTGRSIRNTSALVLTLALAACGGEPQDSATGTGDSQQLCDAHGVCVLSGTFTDDLTLKADKRWLLRGGVFIGDDTQPATLTIEPGTTIYGETSTNGMLVIRRHARLVARGTAEKPIVFTSSKPAGQRVRGDWGGVILNGLARVNTCKASQAKACQSYGEGGTGYYGGDRDDDDSGVLRYVRIEFAGRLISPDNELNGLALQGVGSKTELSHIQVHMAKDDGLEFFGGTASFKYVLTTGIADDNLDWTDGWRGKGQYFIAQQYDDAGDNGIEADNNAENNTATPRSQPTLSNITLIGSPDSKSSDIGILLREGTGARIYNAAVLGWNEACLDIDDAETFANGVKNGKLTGELTIERTLLSCAKNFDEESGDAFRLSKFFNELNKNNSAVAPQLAAPHVREKPDFRPKKGSPAATGGETPQDAFFTRAAFRGGMSPDSDWTKGWTTAVRN